LVLPIMDMGVRSWMAFGIICGMRQLELFTRTELAGMRDRSRARNYSASRDEFRRVQAGRRVWGLQRRHGERLRQIREREAGCWPADLEVLHGAVQEARSGITEQLSPDTARLLVRRGDRRRASDPPARSVEPARPARQAGPAGKPTPHTGEHSAAKPSSPPSNHGRRPAPTLSHEQAPRRDHAPAEEQAGVTTPRPTARPPRPGRADEHQSRPIRPPVTRHARKPAADNQQSHDQSTLQKATLAPSDKVLNPRQNPQQHCHRIPP
jgi:hypothetical protein